MTDDSISICTVGHSNHTLEGFLALLRRHRIAAVADVRSVPYSRFSPHFSRAALAEALQTSGIGYLYLGRELGGRPADPACYENERIRYERVAQTGGFRAGIAGLLEIARKQCVAVMCAEKEPLDCHRTLLVARALEASGAQVEHILADGELEPHAQTMDRLLAKFDFDPEGDLLQPRQDCIAQAVRLQAGRTAFVKERSAAAPQRQAQ